MATNIYLVRHGESLGNVENRFLGYTDWDLTEKGYKQAEFAADYFNDKKVDAIYSSSLMRAKHTADVLAKRKGLEVKTSPKLREIYGGDWEEMRFEDIAVKYKDGLWKLWLEGVSDEIATPNGESFKDVLKRVYDELEAIAQQNDGKEVVVAVHGAVIRVMTHFLRFGNLKNIKQTDFAANASVTKIVYDKGSFTLEFADERSHLGDLVTLIGDIKKDDK